MQDQSDTPTKRSLDRENFVSTRHRDAAPDNFDPNKPRLGRRESEPHSAEITYLYNVLRANFPNDRTMWDLHHYFKKNKLEIDIQFDISFFKNLDIPYTLTSYNADQFDDRVPDMAINILSKSTWRSDLAEKVDQCRLLGIPLYIVFPSYHVANDIYKPPFLQAYVLKENGKYEVYELRETINPNSEELNIEATIDVTDIVPFRLGLQKRKRKHQDDESLYRLILIDPEKDKILLTKSEKIINEKERKIKEQKQKIEELGAEIKELREKLEGS